VEAVDTYLTWFICEILFAVRDETMSVRRADAALAEEFRRERMALQAYLVRD
jgi:hypothetical protein